MALIQGIVDTQKQNLKSLGIVNSGDDLTIELEVKQNGVNIEFVNPIFELLATKSDGTRVRQLVDITYIGNVVNIIGDEQLVTSPGIVTLQLIIKDNKRSSTCLFYFMCGTSLDRDIIQSISKVEVLNQLDEYVVQAFANLKEYEQRIIASDASIRNLNEDMIKAEKVRVQAEINRGNTFDNLVLKMNNAINAAIATDETLQNNEIKRIDNYNTLKAELESIKDDLILLNNNISKEEEKRVQAEIDRVNKTLEIIEKLKSTNDKVTIAEAERVTEFNNIKSELTSLKEALTTINNIANSNEEIRKTNESGRVAAEQQRVTDFEKIKSDNTSLGVALTKKVDDKIVEIEANNNTFKQGINEQYDNIVTENNIFKNKMDTDYGNAKVDYFGEEHTNVINRLNSDFDNVHQRINDSSYLEYSGSNIKADNSYFGLCKDLSIKGRTLQNLNGTKRSDYRNNESNFFDEQTQEVVLKGIGTWNTTGTVNSDVVSMFKPNSKYTCIVNITKNTLVSSASEISLNTNFGNENLFIESWRVPINSIGTFTTTLTTQKDFTPIPPSNTNFVLRSQLKPEDVSGELRLKVIILEGDYTTTPISDIPYGKGIYSVGENENNLVTVKSCGKNLFDGKLETGTINNTTGENNNSQVTKRSDFIKVKPPFTFSRKESTDFIGLRFYDVNKKFIEAIALNNTNYTCTNKIVNYFRFISVDGIVNNDYQIEEGTKPTPYSPYQESKQSYQLTEPLRSLPNGVSDEIIGGELIRRVGIHDIDAKFVSVHSITDNFITFTMYKEGVKYNTKGIICNTLPYNGAHPYYATGEGVWIGGSSNIWVCVAKSKLSSSDALGVKQWLQQNPTTVYYELETPIVTPIEPVILNSFKDVTHINFENSLPGTITTKIASNVQAVLQDTRTRNVELEKELSETQEELDIYVNENTEILEAHADYDVDNDFRITMLELGLL